jgi:hypothetical protein
MGGVVESEGHISKGMHAFGWLLASFAPPSFNFLEFVLICLVAKQCPEVSPHCRLSQQQGHTRDECGPLVLF